ncbi:MAG: YvcK family protein [Anaerolineae bacterium]|nr:YvcK family protein [Anaerolineae bacterium]
MSKFIPNPRSLLKWLIPGIGIKRWLVLLFFGSTLLGLGLAMLLVDLYRAQPEASWMPTLTLRGWPMLLRAGLAGIAGMVLIGLALIQINRSILAPLDTHNISLVEAMLDRRQGRRGPKIVAVGGGTGMPTLLRSLKQITSNLTAIVTVADDGGSSGKLRRELGVLPPGDFRNNLAALARDEGLMVQLFQYRFGEGGLEGHSFGNLFITALSSVTGSFEQALIESSRVLAIRGQVLPSTLSDVTLMADLREEHSNGTRRVAGESIIPKTSGTIERVFLRPDDPPAYPEAVRAILSSDLIMLGPGSLYTSLLPNLLVQGIVNALRATRSPKVYVCNVATQRGETDGYTVGDHVRAIERHIGKQVIDYVLVNNYFPPLEDDANYAYVRLGEGEEHSLGVTISKANLIDAQRPWRHSSEHLAKAVEALLHKMSSQ